MSVDYKSLANGVIKAVADRERKRFKNRELVMGLLGSKTVRFLIEDMPLFRWFSDHIAYGDCKYAGNFQDCGDECYDQEYMFDFRTMDFMELFVYEGEVTDPDCYEYCYLGDNSEALLSLLDNLAFWIGIHDAARKKPTR
mgnify:CR=1 FL=1